jgi:phosphohistidine phosphatase SixA
VNSAPVEAPAPTLADTLAQCGSSESTLATLTLAIHQSWSAFDKASKAYDKARVNMVTAGVIPARIAAQLYNYAVTDKAFHAARGINAGKPAVEKLATHLGYERRRFEPILKAGLALLEANVTLAPEDAVTPEDLEIVAPHLSKDAARQAKKYAEKKETAGAPAVTAPAETDGETVTASAPADDSVILADVIRAIETAAKLAERFAANAGLTRDSMDAIQDALSGISTTLEAVVAEDD